jgi:hypothetical protein
MENKHDTKVRQRTRKELLKEIEAKEKRKKQRCE